MIFLIENFEKWGRGEFENFCRKIRFPNWSSYVYLQSTSISIWKTDFFGQNFGIFSRILKKIWSDFPSRDGCLVGGFEQSYQTFSKRCSEMSLGNRQAIGLFFKKCIFLVSASLSQFSKSNVRISKISSNVDSVKILYKPLFSVFFEKIRKNGEFQLWKWSDFHEIICRYCHEKCSK